MNFWTDTIARKEEDYFIGSIVVYKEKHDLYGIVDGQQRLTTITIILCCLRNFLRSEGFRELSEGIHALVERKDVESKNQFIIQTETSFPYFQEYIQKNSSPSVKVEPKEEEKNLESAYKQINEYLEESIKSIKADPSIKKEDKPDAVRDKLVSFREKILRLKVIFVELDTEDDAYLIFETLNTRGKDLSPSDLVRNLLARFVKPENPQVDSVKLIWQRILNTVEGAPGQVSIDNFLQHYWLSKYEYTSVKNLFRSIRREIQRDNANDYLNDLEYHSKIYRSLFEPTFRTWRNDEDNIKKSLEAFVQFRVRQPLPLPSFNHVLL